MDNPQTDREGLFASVVSGFAKAFGTSLITRALQLLLAVALVRAIGDGGYGAYLFAGGVALIGGRLGALGTPNLMLRFVPEYQSKADWSGLSGLFRSSVQFAAIGSVGVAVILAIGAAHLGGEHPLTKGVLVGAILVPLVALRGLARAQLVALGHPSTGVFLDGGVVPIAMLLILLGFGVTIDAHFALWGLVASSAFAVFFGASLVLPRIPQQARDAPAQMRTRLWLGIAAPTMLGMSSKLLMEKSDILMLAPLSGLSDVGVYGAASRLVLVQTMAAVILNTVVVPRMSEALAQDRQTKAVWMLIGSLGFALAVSLPFALLFWQMGKPIMGYVFTPDFAHGNDVLRVLALAQVCGALSVPLSAFLIVAGRQNLFGVLTFGALSVNVMGNLILIPLHGAVGAAWASLVSMSLLVILQFTLCMNTPRAGRPVFATE